MNGTIKKKLNLIVRDRGLYLIALPGILYFIIFHYVPMYGITLAFQDFNIFKGFSGSEWVGLDNFTKLFSMYGFTRAFKNTIIISFMNLVCSFPIPIILAIAINEIRSLRYKKLVQTSIYLPHFVSWVIVSGILMTILSPNSGVLRGILDSLGISAELPNFFTSKASFRWLLVFSGIWKESGYGTIMYLATIVSIDQQLYEAAIVDGAGKWKQIWHITLPGLRSTIIVLLILRVGQILNVGLEQIFAMYNPAVYEVSEVLDTYIYKIGLQEVQYSLATAAGLFKSSIGLILVLITNKVAKMVDPESGLI